MTLEPFKEKCSVIGILCKRLHILFDQPCESIQNAHKNVQDKLDNNGLINTDKYDNSNGNIIFAGVVILISTAIVQTLKVVFVTKLTTQSTNVRMTMTI